MNIPLAISTLGPIEPPFETPKGQPYLSYGLGPTSKVIGGASSMHGYSGASWGLFSSQWLNQRDECLNCVAHTQQVVEIAPSYAPNPTNITFTTPLACSLQGLPNGIVGYSGK